MLGLWSADNPGRGLHSFADWLTAAGRISGLLGTYHVWWTAGFARHAPALMGTPRPAHRDER